MLGRLLCLATVRSPSLRENLRRIVEIRFFTQLHGVFLSFCVSADAVSKNDFRLSDMKSRYTVRYHKKMSDDKNCLTIELKMINYRLGDKILGRSH